jgi:hypothetical protein
VKRTHMKRGCELCLSQYCATVSAGTWIRQPLLPLICASPSHFKNNRLLKLGEILFNEEKSVATDGLPFSHETANFGVSVSLNE